MLRGRPAVYRGLLLVLLVSAIAVAVFHGYLSGKSVPPWDFFGPEPATAHYWWSNGGILHPPKWMPITLGGYPAPLDLATLGWYLPAGIASLFTSLGLRVFATLQVVHFAFGSIGAYLLVRRMGSRYLSGLFVAGSYFFVPGYFASAEHLSIPRSYSYLPWLMLVASTRWPWRRLWAIPVGAILIWQAALGMYPGMEFTAAYAGAIWLTVTVVADRRLGVRVRDTLVPLGLACSLAALMCAPRYWGYLANGGGGSSGSGESSAFDKTIFATIQFGYGALSANDISMRPFFLPAATIVLAIVALVVGRSAMRQGALLLLVPAVVFGIPGSPLFDAGWLPGTQLSRFTMSDFRMISILSVNLLAASAIDALLGGWRPSPVRWMIVAAAGFGLVFALIDIGSSGPFSARDWQPAIVLLSGSVVVTVGWLSPIARLRFGGLARSSVVVFLLFVTMASGYLWARGTTSPWITDRVAGEVASYGAPVARLVEQRANQPSLLQRPARTSLDLWSGDPNFIAFNLGMDYRRNAGFFNGQYALGGYSLLKGSKPWVSFRDHLYERVTHGDLGLHDFLVQPGTVAIQRGEGEWCMAGTDCGPASVAPTAYEPGVLDYDVVLRKAATVSLNEIYYDGWKAEICVTGRCAATTVTADLDGLVSLNMPAGRTHLTLSYEPKAWRLSLITQWVGIIATLFSPVVILSWRRRTRRIDPEVSSGSRREVSEDPQRSQIG